MTTAFDAVVRAWLAEGAPSPEVRAMRSQIWARWAICALAIPMLASIPAFADRSGRSVADCTNFNQADKGDSSVEFTIHNGCTIPVDCSISWRVVCAPDAPKRRASHAGNASLKLGSDNASQTAEASASVCGDDSWAIQSIQWSCQPNRD